MTKMLEPRILESQTPKTLGYFSHCKLEVQTRKLPPFIRLFHVIMFIINLLIN